MSSDFFTLADIQLSKDQPTTLSLSDVCNWIIWQFPKIAGKGLCGAVHPPIAGYGWFPANVEPGESLVHIYANVATPFKTPESAAQYIETAVTEPTP